MDVSGMMGHHGIMWLQQMAQEIIRAGSLAFCSPAYCDQMPSTESEEGKEKAVSESYKQAQGEIDKEDIQDKMMKLKRILHPWC